MKRRSGESREVYHEQKVRTPLPRGATTFTRWSPDQINILEGPIPGLLSKPLLEGIVHDGRVNEKSDKCSWHGHYSYQLRIVSSSNAQPIYGWLC